MGHLIKGLIQFYKEGDLHHTKGCFDLTQLVS